MKTQTPTETTAKLVEAAEKFVDSVKALDRTSPIGAWVRNAMNGVESALAALASERQEGEKPAPAFSVGQRVRVKRWVGPREGQEGRVKGPQTVYGQSGYSVEFGDGFQIGFLEYEIEPIPEPQEDAMKPAPQPDAPPFREKELAEALTLLTEVHQQAGNGQITGSLLDGIRDFIDKDFRPSPEPTREPELPGELWGLWSDKEKRWAVTLSGQIKTSLSREAAESRKIGHPFSQDWRPIKLFPRPNPEAERLMEAGCKLRRQMLLAADQFGALNCPNFKKFAEEDAHQYQKAEDAYRSANQKGEEGTC